MKYYHLEKIFGRGDGYMKNTRVSQYKKQIGATVYTVNVFFDDESNETLEDKLLKIILKKDLQTMPNYDIMKKLQTERLPGGLK